MHTKSILSNEQKIKSKVKNQIENQKEYYLNEQLKATQDELKELTGKDSIYDDCNAMKKINNMKISKKHKEKLLEEVKTKIHESNIIRKWGDKNIYRGHVITI